MNRTAIEWTTFSANPLKYRDAAGRVVWGCVHASEGCRHCYSEALTKRYGRGGPFTAQVMKSLTPFLDDAELRHMLKAKVIGGVPVAGSRCFVGDMTDLFGQWVPDGLLDRLFAAFAWRRDVTWQILTKRAIRLQAYSAGLAALGPKGRTRRFVDSMYQGHPAERLVGARIPDDHVGDLDWPLPNVWLGVSVEDQATADERIPLLLETPAAVRFVSYEPALGPVDFGRALRCQCSGGYATGPRPLLGCWCVREKHHSRLRWLIVGGESGPGARPFDVAWARSAIEQCRAAQADVAVFLKQLGEHVHWNGIQGGGIPLWPDGLKWEEHDGAWCRRFHKKGGDQALMPEDLRVRELPS